MKYPKALPLILIMFLLGIVPLTAQPAITAENEFAADVFKTKYKKGSFERFPQKVQLIDDNTFQFGEKILQISFEEKLLRPIFEKGIFNPDVIFGQTTRPPTKSISDTLDSSQKEFYNLIRNDSLKICCIKEVKGLNPNPQTKRYKFWVFDLGLINPTEYYFELYNEHANQDTPLDEFLKNARMTFYYKGSIII
jgi:hypothetical protein